MPMDHNSDLFRPYRNPADDEGKRPGTFGTTVHTQIIPAKGDVDLTLTPEEQLILLAGLRTMLMFHHPNVAIHDPEARQQATDQYINERILLGKFEAAMKQVGLDVTDLEGVEYL